MLNEEKSASGGEEQNKESAPEVTEIIPPTPVPDKPKLFKIKVLILGVCGVLVLASFAGAFLLGKNQTPNDNNPSANPSGKACTQEAKICPDGSSVGRTGPNCEFAPCPTTSSSATTQDGKYISKKFKISFIVPNGWNAIERDGGAYPTSLDLYNYDYDAYTKAMTDQKKNTPDGFSNLFRISFGFSSDAIKTKPSNMTLLAYAKSENSNTNLFSFEEIKVDSQEAIIVKKSTSDHLGPVYSAYILKDNKIYKIDAYSDYPTDTQAELKKFESIFKEVLTSFKFN